MLYDLPLARATVDRDAEARFDAGLIGRLANEPTTHAVIVHNGLVAVSEPGDLVLLTPAEVPGAPWDADHVAYLGRDGEARYAALVLPEHLGEERDLDGVPIHEDAALVDLVGKLNFRHLRDVGDTLSDRDAGLATTAVALAAWHARHPRCPRCGEPTDVVEAGWVRRCSADKSLHYPRTDPAVIMGVIDDQDRVLLGHAAHWPEGRFSTLAGYVEPGEALESAVRREVFEETSVRVGEVSYVGSQPWPFPASLMIGYLARVADGEVPEVKVDGVELTDARFFTREELTEAVTAGTVHLPMRSSIARAIIEHWYGAALPVERPTSRSW